MSFEKNLRRFCRALPSTLPPPHLRNRVFGALPPPVRPSLFRRLSVAGVLSAVLITVLLLAPPRVTPGFAQAMQSAVAQAQTWHFVGWRLQNGKKVRWEIWGRRTPYFYREQIGDDIQMEDSTRRIRLIPPEPNTPYGRRIGMAIMLRPSPLSLATQQTQDAVTGAFARGTGSENFTEMRQSQQSGGTVTLRSSTHSIGSTDRILFLTADARTKLPLRLRIHETRYKDGFGDDVPNRPIAREGDQAVLAAQYNIALPADLSAPVIPGDYRQVDFTGTPPATALPEGAVTQNGLTVYGNVIAQDAEGNLHLQFRAFFGSQPFRSQDLPLRLGIVNEQFDGRPFADTNPITRNQFATDDRGNHYVAISSPPVVSYSDAPEIYLVPVEPLSPSAPRPTRLTINIVASPEFSSNESVTGESVSLMKEKMRLSLPLPANTTPLGYDTASSPQVIVTKRWTLAQTAASARSFYYAAWRSFGDPPPFSNEDVMHDRDRARYWQQRAKQNE